MVDFISLTSPKKNYCNSICFCIYILHSELRLKHNNPAEAKLIICVVKSFKICYNISCYISHIYGENKLYCLFILSRNIYCQQVYMSNPQLVITSICVSSCVC